MFSPSETGSQSDKATAISLLISSLKSLRSAAARAAQELGENQKGVDDRGGSDSKSMAESAVSSADQGSWNGVWDWDCNGHRAIGAEVAYELKVNFTPRKVNLTLERLMYG